MCCSLLFPPCVGAWGSAGDPPSGRSRRRGHDGGTAAAAPRSPAEPEASVRSGRARIKRGGDQPVREPRGPESPSAATVRRVLRRRAPHKAQSRNGSTASGGGARAITPPQSNPQDASPPELRCLTAPRGASPFQRRALEVRGWGRPTAPGSQLTRRGRERRPSRPPAPLRRPR
ncbi:hypothetical protein NDU88_002059 [Pleurodeles waltl]|uniref:Uncharacterized protein n=1 Tax=Pleurodeles waltl TaxID=8319 RepID=A0AAV7WQI7_PLEWA|nr:hypothetical protein NDU88_002059 [Pleurodeles waltl]